MIRVDYKMEVRLALLALLARYEHGKHSAPKRRLSFPQGIGNLASRVEIKMFPGNNNYVIMDWQEPPAVFPQPCGRSVT